MREWSSIVAVLSLLVAAGCESTDCDPNKTKPCPDKQACLRIGEDQGGPGYRCRPVDDNGKVKCAMAGSVVGCTEAEPICGPDSVCTTCKGFAVPDDACKGATPDKPYCKIAVDNMSGVCVQCKGTGSTSIGCPATAPVCDDSGKCGLCTKHSDCSVGLCRLTEYQQPPGGSCPLPSDVAYVGKTNCNDAGGGSKAQPFCEIAAAIASNRSFISVDTGTYGGFAVTGGNRVLIGQGSGTIIGGAVVASANAAFWMEGVRVSLPAGVMNVNAAVYCQSGATLTLSRSIIEGAPTNIPGIDAAVTCGQLTVRASHVRANGGPGILIESGRKYAITNSLIAENEFGVVLGMTASGPFVFNTVRNNNVSGVECKSNQLLDSSIIVNNGGVGVAPQGLTGCTFATSHVGSMADANAGLVRADPPEFVGSVGAADNYKLKAGSARNQACCIDKADNTSVKDDYFGAARPKGTKSDIGFHELQ